jgi:hypothetical protein
MSGVAIVEPDWPRHAKQADYEKFSRCEQLDIEQLASLSAGFMFRAWRGASPINEDPTRKVTLKDGTIVWRKRPRPYAAAVNWAVLRRPDGAVGLFMTRWFRRHPDVYFASPREWVAFRKREGLPLHPDFRSHFRPPARRLSAREAEKETANRARETVYRKGTLEVVTVLARLRGVRLTKRELWKLVIDKIHKQTQEQFKVPKFDRFKQLLTKWRLNENDTLGRKFVRVLHKRRGPIPEDEKDAVRIRLRAQAPEFAAVLFPNSNRRSSLRV